jgi:hypothetical protein
MRQRSGIVFLLAATLGATALVSTPAARASASAPAAVSPVPVQPIARLVHGSIRITAELYCADPDGGSNTVYVTVGQVMDRGRVLVGKVQTYADCEFVQRPVQTIDVPSPSDESAKFHTGQAFVTVQIQQGVRAGDDFVTYWEPPGWGQVDVKRNRAASSTGATLNSQTLASATADPAAASVTLANPVLLQAGGAGALVAIGASCDASVFHATLLAVSLRQRLSAVASAEASAELPQANLEHCDGLEHVTTFPVIPTGGCAFHPGTGVVRSRLSTTLDVNGEGPPPTVVAQLSQRVMLHRNEPWSHLPTRGSCRS